MNHYLDVLKKYTAFDGRSRRAEYWHFVLFNFIISLIINFSSILIGKNISLAITVLFALLIIIPTLAVSVRRLHDTGKSGWWLLIGLIPIIGAICIIVLMCIDSNPGDNKYGPNPKGVTATN